MTLIHHYKVVRTPSGPEQCISSEPSICPNCGKQLKYRDRRIRCYKTYNGEKRRIVIRRLKCSNKDGCGRLHNELPDFLSPYKHYTSEIIENVIDGVSTPCDPSTEDYPCERTMQRWTLWFFFNCILLEMAARYLKRKNFPSLSRSRQFSSPALSSFRREGTGWLSFLIRFIYNCGGRMPAWRG